MREPLIYFAFGSNLHKPQMEERCPGCSVLQPGVLKDYRLAFCGQSPNWGGGVATILPEQGAEVQGLLYALSEADLQRLDAYEGYPGVYEHLPVGVTARDGTRQDALTYRKRNVDLRPPSVQYFYQMWRAYRALGLDEALLARALDEVHDL